MFAKKFLYLSDNRLAAWQWRGGKLAHSGDFNLDPDGYASFDDYLAQAPGTPIHILVDVIEEDFRNETIPHILGKDRQTLIERKLNQLFRTTTYRHASLQGRETAGRRDDKLLLTGLTNEELLKPWVDRIAQRKLPLAGIYSLPHLSQMLAKKVKLLAPHQLLITRQSTGLRQSYFQEGLLKFSRLTLLASDDMLTMQDTVHRECLRTQQYLNSLRLLPRDQPLDIALCGARYLQQLQPESMSAPLLRYQLFGLEDIFRRLGLKIPGGDLTSELLYLNLLGRFHPPQHYASPGQRWYDQLRLIRAGILGATAATIAASAYVSLMNFNQALDDHQQGDNIAHETQGLQRQYQTIKSTFPPTPVPAEDMKNAVELVEAAARKNVMPDPLLGLISRALEAAPAIRLNQIKWSVSDKPSEEPTATPPPPAGKNENIVASITINRESPYQIAILDGEITPFSDYRSALESVNHFVEALKKTPPLQVAPLVMPINIGSQASLQGSVGKKGQDNVTFSVKLILAPTP